MCSNRLCRSLLLLTVVCLLATPALALTPEREADRGVEAGDRVGDGWTASVRDTVDSLWSWVRVVIEGGGVPVDDDRTPGSGLDPDGNKHKSD